ncbi:MAG: type II toxin-antitoxin system RatA family toxin [Zoogloeaceae bacterium]|jgi:ribosome-associated toxin RatA of RatAB toxin-antitoxin module|nr:type II toxin-antitoxin system RatA family toxin [Zoogloeaceae bacterium]
MAKVEKSVLVARSARQMFDLVDTCENYPDFLPWCGQAVCDFRDETHTVGTLHINYHGVKTQFTTENDKKIPEWMRIKLVRGPFRQLAGMWRFIPLREDACKVEFALSYEFSSKLFEKIIGPVFNHIANTFVDAFVKRAREMPPQPATKEPQP